MGYATQADLVPLRISQDEIEQLAVDQVGLTDEDKAAAVAAVVTSCLTEASALVDSYCRQRYTLPLQVSEQVKGLAISIALYKLFLRRRRVTDDIRREFDDAMQFLRDVAANKAGLDQPVAATPQAAAGEVVSTKVEEKFSDCNLEGFI